VKRKRKRAKEVDIILKNLTTRCGIVWIFPEPEARSAGAEGNIIPHGYLHPGKAQHSGVQSHFAAILGQGRYLWWSSTDLKNMADYHEGRTLYCKGFRKGENKDEDCCCKTIKDSWEGTNAAKKTEKPGETTMNWNTRQAYVLLAYKILAYLYEWPA
jgi:hypothetical protein